MKSIFGPYILAFFLSGFSNSVFCNSSEDRVAIVIGNSKYIGLSSIRNSVADANLVSTSLSRLDFETHVFMDVDSEALQKIRHLVEKRINKHTILFFYFSGYAFQVDGRNFLIPVDAQVEGIDALADKSLYLGDMLSAIEKRRPRLAAFILDASRISTSKNEMINRSIGKGLARVEIPRSTLFFSSNRPVNLSADQVRGESLFTKALLDELAVPNQMIEVIFRKVTKKIFDATKGDQEPWLEGSARYEFVPTRIPVKNNELTQNTTSSSLADPEIPIMDSIIAEDHIDLIPLTAAEIEKRTSQMHTASASELTTSFICQENGCYDYKQWVKSLNSSGNLEQLKMLLKTFLESPASGICVFDLMKSKCTGKHPKLWVIYPLIFTRPTTLRGLEFSDSKLASDGSLMFKATPIFYAGESRKEGCFAADGVLSFSLDQINFDISRHACLNVVVPASVKNSFQVLYADLVKREIVARWNLNMISVLATGGGKELVKISYVKR